MRLDRDILHDIKVSEIAKGEITDSHEAVIKAKVWKTLRGINNGLAVITIAAMLMAAGYFLAIPTEPTDTQLTVGIIAITSGIVNCIILVILALASNDSYYQSKCLYLLHRLKKYEEIK